MNKKVVFAALAAVSVVLSVAGLTRFLPPPTAAAKGPEVRRAQAPVAQGEPADSQIEDPNAVYRVPIDGSPVRGPEDALVTIVEVADFECPYCKKVEPTLRRVLADYGAKVRLVFKHYPVAGHANAVPAAMLAEQARILRGEAGFWSAHDRILELPELSRSALQGVGAGLGLAPAMVKDALDGKPALNDRLRADGGLVIPLGVNGTPFFFVNGRKLAGAQPYEAFKALVDEEVAKAERRVASGVAPRDVYARLVGEGASRRVMIAAPARPATGAAAGAPAAPREASGVVVRADDPVKGPSLAPVTVVIFSDFQCPFCARVEPTLEQVRQAYPKDVRIVWKHLPLSFHPNALPAAKAAEAARTQGRFWEMHDRLFAAQQSLSDGTYGQAARELKLDPRRFDADRAGDTAARRITEDGAVAAANGATGTPTMFVNCRKLVGAQPLEAFKKVVDEELAKAKGHPVDAGFYDRACAANVAAAPPAVPPSSREVKVAIRQDDPIRGGRNAKVTVVEFSDFQCPFCSRAEPVVKEVEKEFGGDVRVVWKHLPLSFHPNAMPAAIASEAARQQGKFWEMHDKLFAEQKALSEVTCVRYAKDLGLDAARFERSLRDPATRARVEADAKLAADAGVTGTPTFLVNGEPVLGAGGLKDAVRRHLEKARGTKG
jgi:protein-disulfide isomerase